MSLGGALRQWLVLWALWIGRTTISPRGTEGDLGGQRHCGLESPAVSGCWVVRVSTRGIVGKQLGEQLASRRWGSLLQAGLLPWLQTNGPSLSFIGRAFLGGGDREEVRSQQGRIESGHWLSRISQPD